MRPPLAADAEFGLINNTLSIIVEIIKEKIIFLLIQLRLDKSDTNLKILINFRNLHQQLSQPLSNRHLLFLH